MWFFALKIAGCLPSCSRWLVGLKAGLPRKRISISAAETRLAALRIHEALVNSRVPGYVEAYESRELHFAGLERAKRELEELVDAALWQARTNLPTE